MFRIGSVQGITKYLLVCALTLSSECQAALNKVQNVDSQKEQFSKSSSRSLLYSWDDDSGQKFRYNHNSDQSEKVIYIVVTIIIFAIAMICKCCQKGCNEDEEISYSDAVVHSPPRTSATAAPPSSRFGYSGTSTTSSSVLSPPRTSRSIILPFEGDTFPAHLYGIDNPNYEPVNSVSEQYYSPISQNQTPLCDILDMPPSYDTVVKEDIKYPKPTRKS